MKKFVLIVLISMGTVHYSMVIARQESAQATFLCGIGNVDDFEDEQELVVEYDEFDQLADATIEPPLYSMRDYVPGWVKAFGIRLLLTYFSLKEYFSESWKVFKKRLALIYGAKKMQESVMHEA